MLGTSLVEQWTELRPDDELHAISRADVDLTDSAATARYIEKLAPDTIVHAAAVVGGIAAKLANPTRYLLDNLLVDTSVISAAMRVSIPELLYIGSAVVYPEHYRQPLLEGDMLAAPLEPANEGYAIAKIAGTKLCEYASSEFGLRYRVAVPSNLYGPHDHFSPTHGHLIASALRKVHEAHASGANTVSVWGDGLARREFTYAPDLAAWIVDQAGRLDRWPTMLNLGQGTDHSITEYYEAARDAVGFTGEFEYDTDKPSGTPQRLLDSAAARELGWSPSTTLERGMANVYAAYLASMERPHAS
ncbi:MAG: NAD-dependent epimerase/dehydratase family protein [Microbacteriaceae bacterium]|jgi:GDP-L-fucose synthase|nr:NAD-dependent epimerase/dehydratase family protein [Microbacteriaceae bacterium]